MLDSALASTHLALAAPAGAAVSQDEAAAESGTEVADEDVWSSQLVVEIVWHEGSLPNGGVTLLPLSFGCHRRVFLRGAPTLTTLPRVCVQVWAVCDVLTRNLKHWGGLGSMSLYRSMRCLPESFVQLPHPLPLLPSLTQPPNSSHMV